MLAYFIALLQGKRGLDAILHALEQTRERLDTFVETQEIAERDIRVRVVTLREQGELIRIERERAERVYDNLTKVLGLGESE